MPLITDALRISTTSELPIFVTRRPNWTPSGVGAFASRLGVIGDVIDAGPWHIVRSHSTNIEVYQASHSFRLTRATFDPERANGSSDGLTPDRAISLATAFFDNAQTALSPQVANSRQTPSTTNIETTTGLPDGSEESTQVTAVQVNFRFRWAGWPMLGPGAKAQATITGPGEVDQGYLFWRDLEPVDDVWRIADPNEALGRLANAPRLAPLLDRTDIALTRLQLGWLCLPPPQPQDVLLPVFEVAGSFTTEALPLRQFVWHIAATPPRTRRAKLGAFIAESRHAAGRVLEWPPTVVA